MSEWHIRFGTAGTSDSFEAKGYKSSLDILSLIHISTSNDGMTDMILYCQFDIKGGALRMLQIPRNSLVCTKSRKVALSNGKTYAAKMCIRDSP